MTQHSFDDMLGAAVRPTLTVLRTLGTVCGWCLRDCGGQLAGVVASSSKDGRSFYTNICTPCRDKHGLNAHLHAIRDGRVIIIESEASND